METHTLEIRINELLQDPNFLKLKSLQSKSNLFEIIAASHTEMWHSAFVKWLIDPGSSLGLGTFPLQRFLFMVSRYGVFHEEAVVVLDLAAIVDEEKLKLSEMLFQTEYADRSGEDKLRLDIIGTNDVLRITIENKIKANESKDQTERYYHYLQQSTGNFEYDLMIYLSPDEAKAPSSSKFIQINYQLLCDHVIKPCLQHPELTPENKFLILQYLANLGKPIKGGKVMAQPNRDLCLTIYNAYKDVFDEIYVSVKGEAPASRTTAEQIKSYNISLSQLMEKGILSLSDQFKASFKGKDYTAALIKLPEDDAVQIKFHDQLFNSPSKAATAITQKNANGWNFWDVYDVNGRFKGKLSELRAELTKDEQEEQ